MDQPIIVGLDHRSEPMALLGRRVGRHRRGRLDGTALRVAHMWKVATQVVLASSPDMPPARLMRPVSPCAICFKPRKTT